MDRRLLAKQTSCFLAANDDRILLLAEAVVGCEWHLDMPGAGHAPILEGVALLVIAMCQPFRVGDDICSVD